MQVCHFQHLLRQFDKNEPGRFLGEGVSFRAKLIGVLEVPEARGDRMCQEALADLKMAIRAAGEHKQRIQVHVAIDGLRLRDDKTGDSLYHHPVHKISFIAQDMTDSRAFGYIFGSPDTGHRFFGIKTDKAASQVVIAMRDLFQVVFELKKKEVEMAKQQLEGKTVTSLARHTSTISETKLKQSLIFAGDTTSILKSAEAAEGGVAELVDLEQELSSLRRGLTQVEGLTPSTDPFGDSFIVPQSQKGLLPPPPSGANSRGRNTPASTKAVFSPNKTQLPFDLAPTEFEPSLVDNITEPPPVSTQAPTATSSLSYDVFTELDPLGTGRSKPYVDKKLFFQELKNPPKKVLNDLVPTTQSLLTDVPVATESKADYGPATSMTSLSRQSGGTVAVAKFGANYYSSDPFAETDPFDNTDPFSDTFKEDPFTSVHEFPKGGKDDKIKLSRDVIEKESVEEARGVKSVFNGPLQVSLPPEPAPKSPRLQRQNTDSSSIRQRPHVSKPTDNASPPPPLPPKKVDTTGRPPPRPPHEEREDKDEEGPPLPRPARKIGGEERLFGGQRIPSDRWAGSRWSRGTHSSSDEYLTPAPAPARRFDMTLAQLLTCPLPQLAARLRVPAETLSSMTLPQLTEYLRSYLAADIDRANINVEPSMEIENDRSLSSLNSSIEKPASATPPIKTEFKPQFEDNFAPTSETADGFVANFDDFDKKANPSYDRYAAFREIQEQELKTKSVLDPLDSNEDSKQDVDTDREELAQINNRVEIEIKDRSPLKSLGELTLDSLNMFRSSVSPKPIDAKIEDIKSVMKNLQIDTKARRSVSPRENNNVSDLKSEDYNDRYAALREITITEPPADEFESLPPEPPKERKKSDEKSDGFDNSDFFDCIDNSSLSFSHVEDAFRKSPVVKEREEEKKNVEDKTVVVPEILPVRELQPPTRLSTGSISDVASVSSLDAKERRVAAAPLGGSRWAVLGGAGSPCSSDSPPPRHKRGVQTSSSSRDASPWDEEPLRIARPSSHHSHSKHNSSGSRECLDSGSGRERDKEKKREKRDSRDRELSRDGRDSGRDRRDSGSGRDRRDLSKDRDHRDHRRERRSRDRDSDVWERDRTYSRDRDYHSRSRERGKDYRDKDRDRHRKARHSYDEDEDYSDGCESGRSSPRERWSDQRWRRDERNYGSLGWRESRRRPELRQSDSGSDRRYGSTLGWPGRRTSSRRDSDRDSRDTRDTRDVRDMRDVRDTRDMRDTRDSRDNRDARRRRRDEPRRRDYRFSNDFSPRDRDHPSPFDNDFQDTPTPTVKKRTPYSSLEGTRFAFDSEEPTASPLSVSSARARDPDSPATRFRFDSDSISPRSMFEDDFTAPPRGRTASIAEEDESDVPPLRTKPVQHRDIKKSESVNIFTRESDPFENDAFFACTGSDRVARRENWPGDFQGFNA